MRALWRNVLWLSVAATCGAAGLWFGWNRGVEDGINASGAMQAQFSAGNSLGRIAMAMDVLDQGDSKYADLNLRSALFELGSNAELLDGWWTCGNNAQALKRAEAYLDSHPVPADPNRDPSVARALRMCDKSPPERTGGPFRI